MLPTQLSDSVSGIPGVTDFVAVDREMSFPNDSGQGRVHTGPVPEGTSEKGCGVGHRGCRGAFGARDCGRRLRVRDEKGEVRFNSTHRGG